MNRIIEKTVQRIFRYMPWDRDMWEVAGGAAVAFTLRLTAAGLSFVFNIILARLLGVEGSWYLFSGVYRDHCSYSSRSSRYGQSLA